MVPRMLMMMLSAVLTAAAVRAEYRLDRLSWPEVEDALAAGTDTVLLTVGATEQHGPHLALAADSATGDCLAPRLAERLGGTLVGPNIRVGISPHHMPFPGTLSARPAVLADYVGEHVHSLAAHGFQHIVILPTHGTNFAMAGELGESLDTLYPHIDIFGFDDAEAYIGALVSTSEQQGIPLESAGSHAGLSETAMMLACDPGLVKAHLARSGYVGDAYAMGDKLSREGTDAISDIGVLGDPRGATGAVGEIYVEALVALLAGTIKARRDSWAIALPPDGPPVAHEPAPGRLRNPVEWRRGGRYDAARERLEALHQEQPADPAIAIELARTLALLGRPRDAASVLEPLLEDGRDGPRVADLHDELSLLALYHGDLNAARTHKLRAVEIREESGDRQGQARNLLNLGYFLSESGDTAGALEAFYESLALVPERNALRIDIIHLTALTELKAGLRIPVGSRLREIGDAARLPIYRSQARRFYHLNGELLLERGQAAEALVNFRAARRIYDHPLYLESLARASQAGGKFEQAVEYYEAIVGLADARLDIPLHFVRSHYRLGELHDQLGNDAEARRWYEIFIDYWGEGEMDRQAVETARRRLADASG